MSVLTHVSTEMLMFQSLEIHCEESVYICILKHRFKHGISNLRPLRSPRPPCINFKSPMQRPIIRAG